MSWNFSVSEKNRDDAHREFCNKLAENERHIPNAIGNALHNAARELMFEAKTNQPCTVSTAGHFNADSTGNAEIRVIVKEAIEPSPLPAAQANTNEA